MESGIGRHAAETLAKEGYTVFASVRKSIDAESMSRGDDKDDGGHGKGNLIPILLDVTNKTSCEEAVALISDYAAQ